MAGESASSTTSGIPPKVQRDISLLSIIKLLDTWADLHLSSMQDGHWKISGARVLEGVRTFWLYFNVFYWFCEVQVYELQDRSPLTSFLQIPCVFPVRLGILPMPILQICNDFF